MSLRVAAVVAAITFAVWLTGVRGPFHFDDGITPLGDPASQSISAWGENVTQTLRPLAKLTYALEGSLGIDAPARRVTSIAIHAFAAALLALLLASVVANLGAVRAGVLALVWSLHPVHAESVLAIAGRPAVLATALVLGALLAAARARDRTAAALLLAAVLARETAIAALLPLLVISRGRSPRWLLGATAIAAAWLVFTPRYRELAEFSYREMDPVHACVQQLAAVPVGLSLYVRTWSLTIDHGDVHGVLAIAGAAIYVVAIGVLVVAWRRNWTVVALGVAVWLAAIAPTQSVVPKLDPLTERPLALALAGIVIVLAARRWKYEVVLGAIVAIALSIATILRGQLYRSEVALWADTAAKSNALRPHWNYAQSLIEAGRYDDAHAELLLAKSLAPYDVRIESALARVKRLGGK